MVLPRVTLPLVHYARVTLPRILIVSDTSNHWTKPRAVIIPSHSDTSPHKRNKAPLPRTVLDTLASLELAFPSGMASF
jgi:hypothetical protein